MDRTDTASDEPQEGGFYEIRLKGHLHSRWVDWFDGLNVSLAENGETLLTGDVADQAALHGLLRRVRDLGLPLIAVTKVDPKETNKSDTGPDINNL